MAELSGDRRARRSRRLLKQGLLELLREKRFFQISVRDITDRMDLNRGTFYLHYPDTAALMCSVEDDMLSEAQKLVEAHMQETVEGNSLRPVFEPVLDYVVEHREECQALFNNDSSSSFSGVGLPQRGDADPGVAAAAQRGGTGLSAELCGVRSGRADESMAGSGYGAAQRGTAESGGSDGQRRGERRVIRLIISEKS